MVNLQKEVGLAESESQTRLRTPDLSLELELSYRKPQLPKTEIRERKGVGTRTSRMRKERWKFAEKCCLLTERWGARAVLACGRADRGREGLGRAFMY